MRDEAACAFCGARAATATMDMTGHGWRCGRCALAREQAAAAGHDPGMREHLTDGELVEVARAGGREAVAGAVVTVVALALTALTLAAGHLFGGLLALVIGGAAATGHGLHRRRAAQRALAESPTARVVRR